MEKEVRKREGEGRAIRKMSGREGGGGGKEEEEGRRTRREVGRR